LNFTATWRSGYAAACKAVYTGSIPVVASNEKYLQSRFFGLSRGSPKTPKKANSPQLEAFAGTKEGRATWPAHLKSSLIGASGGGAQRESPLPARSGVRHDPGRHGRPTAP
jgi:hypothetical protein